MLIKLNAYYRLWVVLWGLLGRQKISEYVSCVVDATNKKIIQEILGSKTRKYEYDSMEDLVFPTPKPSGLLPLP